ncbi:hypothetical protein GDO81_006295 [Engystomops pustulosus]|uniref:Uncharacterized protein n=1 Tax=Engystomops pustulosus TaxID=76066 RepID=A0AAV7CVR3_ENGPU|nr:hypothetical protein GDO81_006295 [Engystomops pustulosus]
MELFVIIDFHKPTLLIIFIQIYLYSLYLYLLCMVFGSSYSRVNTAPYHGVLPSGACTLELCKYRVGLYLRRPLTRMNIIGKHIAEVTIDIFITKYYKI